MGGGGGVMPHKLSQYVRFATQIKSICQLI